MNKHITIWKSYGMFNPKEIQEYKEQAKLNLLNNDFTEKEITEEQITSLVYEDIDMQFKAEQSNLFKILDGRILAIVSLGLWNGRKSGYKILGNNLNEVLTCGIGCDDIEVYCDTYNVRATGYHHDGINHVEFREIRENRKINNLLNKLYNNKKVTRREINYYTKSLRPYVKLIYGFNSLC